MTSCAKITRDESVVITENQSVWFPNGRGPIVRCPFEKAYLVGHTKRGRNVEEQR